MPTSVDLTDSEGFLWDIRSDPDFGLNILEGTSDAFDTGLSLRVNGTVINGAFSVDENGREVNMAPQLVGGIAVSRSILVSDASISPDGFARFLDSFTNTTDQPVTITVEIITNSGADSALQVTGESSGDGVLTTADTGLVTDDAFTEAADPAVMQAFGDGTLLPTSLTVGNSLVTVTHTLTLQPGETQSLLQFVTQNTTAAEGAADLAFASNNPLFEIEGLLTGLTAEERNSVVNYSNVAAPEPAATLVDADGNRWGIDDQGRLSTLDSDTLQSFSLPQFVDLADTPVSVTEDLANGEVTVVTQGLGGAFSVTSTYTALPGQGVIRLVVTAANFTVIDSLVFSPLTANAAGPTGTQVVQTGLSSVFGIPSAVILDDSESGSGGSNPALSFIFGATGAGDTFTLDGQSLITSMPDQVLGGGSRLSYVFFFALNDSGLAALTDLARLNDPGPEELIGLTAAEVAGFANFDLDETDRLQETLGDNEVDDVITGHAWGDSILGGSGDDELSGLGSDDILRGGIGQDQIDGGDGSDSLFGGDDNDDIFGGNGNDLIDGEDGGDHIFGQAGDDSLSGGNGDDRLTAGSGNDVIYGGNDTDTLNGNIGNDTLNGEAGFDDLYGGAGDDVLAGGANFDLLFGGSGNDTLNGDDADDEMDGGTGRDSMDGGEGADTLLGDAGNDTMNGDTGNDSLNGGANNDFMTGNDGDDTLNGDTGADTLSGGAGDDVLDGGTGADSMAGGTGSDTYTIDVAGDKALETAEVGAIDTVNASVTFRFRDQHIEVLNLTGTGDIDGFGASGNDVLRGNIGKNLLDGGSGADTMEGGDGNDIYVVRNGGDVVIETATGGAADLVRSTRTYTLGDHLEDLALIGTAASDGTGNDGANRITGNGAANVLTGGLGNDTLTGGGGADTFVFSGAISGSNNRDTITDFQPGVERIHLSAADFTGLPVGFVAGGAFAFGTAAGDPGDRLIYNQATGRLIYDSNGSSPGGATIIATFTSLPALTAADFEVVLL